MARDLYIIKSVKYDTLNKEMRIFVVDNLFN